MTWAFWITYPLQPSGVLGLVIWGQTQKKGNTDTFTLQSSVHLLPQLPIITSYLFFFSIPFPCRFQRSISPFVSYWGHEFVPCPEVWGHECTCRALFPFMFPSIFLSFPFMSFHRLWFHVISFTYLSFPCLFPVDFFSFSYNFPFLWLFFSTLFPRYFLSAIDFPFRKVLEAHSAMSWGLGIHA